MAQLMLMMLMYSWKICFDSSWMVDFWLIFHGELVGKYTFHMDPMGLFPNHHSSGVIC